MGAHGTCAHVHMQVHKHWHMNNDTHNRMCSLLMRDNPGPTVPQGDQWRAAICLFYLHDRFPEVCKSIYKTNTIQ